MISFSGIDCGGKSTQIDLLSKELDKKGIKHKIVWSRGGYTPMLEAIKSLFRDEKGNSKEVRLNYSKEINKNSVKRKLLFIASLLDLGFYYAVILRVMELFGTLIICDRYIWDTYIDFKMKYPEYAFEKWLIWKIILRTMLKPKPSLVFFIPAEESMRRSQLKEEPFPEPIETRNERINYYISEVKNNRWQYVIDATGQIQEIFIKVKEKLNLE